LVLVAVALSACRVDTAVDVVMEENGSGVITVSAVADAELVARAPGLADDLRFDDLLAAGWVLEGPATTADGGLSVVLRHTFSSPEQATALLASLNGTDGPLEAAALARTPAERQIDYALSGGARIENGLASFADPDLLASVGATPYADSIAAAGLAPDQVLGLTFSINMPGTVTGTTGAIDPEGGEGRVRWTIPLDGSPLDLTTRSTVSLERSSTWRVLATVALVVLIAWVVASLVLIALVARARRRRIR
jgi:hypothetical protein